MSSGYDVTVTFRVDGAESLSEALDEIGVQRDRGTDVKGLRMLASTSRVEILNVFPIRWNVRSIKEEHKP